MPLLTTDTGMEWLIDAHGCDPAALKERVIVLGVFERAIEELGLKPVGEPLVHVFPAPGGLTALQLLAESHLTCHTFPETGFAGFNLYCCRPRPEWRWAEALWQAVRSTDVRVRCLERPMWPEAVRKVAR